MSIYVEQGQANNDEHLLSLLRNFLNYYGWEEVSVSSTTFTVTKLINNFRWYWQFDVGFSRPTSTVFGLEYGYGTTPTIIYRRRMYLEWAERYCILYTPSGSIPSLQTFRNTILNYYFILNTSPPGETLILIVYQNNIFLTGYLGFSNILLPNQNIRQIHHFCVPCLNITGSINNHFYTGYSFLWGVKLQASNCFPSEIPLLYSFLYYNTSFPNLTGITGGLFTDYNTNFTGYNQTQFLPSLIPNVPLLQPIPIYVQYQNNWSYVGNLKGVYACNYTKRKPATETYGSKTYLFVPALHATTSFTFYSKTIHPQHSYAILINKE